MHHPAYENPIHKPQTPFVLSLSKHERATAPTFIATRHLSPFGKLRANGNAGNVSRETGDGRRDS